MQLRLDIRPSLAIEFSAQCHDPKGVELQVRLKVSLKLKLKARLKQFFQNVIYTPLMANSMRDESKMLFRIL